VGVYDFGEADGDFFLAMEYVEGWTLRQILKRVTQAGGRFPAGAAVDTAEQLCQALHYIHEREEPIVHRDVSPQNIFISRRGVVKLGDFGIAKAKARRTRTQDGKIKGKLCYMAPEQISGEPVTPRTDIYATGLVLYEMLVGRSLIDGDSDMELIRCALNPPAAVPSTLRSEVAPVDPIVRRALERHPQMRYPTAELMAAELNEKRPPSREQGERAPEPPRAAALPDETRRVPETVPLPVVDPPVTPTVIRSRRMIWSASALLILAAALIAGAVLWPVEESPPAVAGGAPPSPADGATSDSQTGVDGLVSSAPGDSAADAAGTRGSPPAAGVNPRGSKQRRRRARRPRRAARPQPAEAPAAPAGPPAEDRARLSSVKAQLVALASTARARGLHPGDVAAVDLLTRRARDRAGAGDAAGAAEILAALEERILAFQIDRRFAEQKLARLSRAVKRARLSDDQQAEMERRSQRILHLIIAGRLVEASREMTRAFSRLRAFSR
jgi:serine/threonine-protein kinase